MITSRGPSTTTTWVANAGLLLVSALVVRLGLEELINTTVNLVGRICGSRPGRKVLTLVHAIVSGASHSDHAEVLRSGATQSVLSHRVMAPSTLGSFLRSFTFGPVHQLEAVVGKVLERAWSLGAGPGKGWWSTLIPRSCVRHEVARLRVGSLEAPGGISAGQHPCWNVVAVLEPPAHGHPRDVEGPVEVGSASGRPAGGHGRSLGASPAH